MAAGLCVEKQKALRREAEGLECVADLSRLALLHAILPRPLLARLPVTALRRPSEFLASLATGLGPAHFARALRTTTRSIEIWTPRPLSIATRRRHRWTHFPRPDLRNACAGLVTEIASFDRIAAFIHPRTHRHRAARSTVPATDSAFPRRAPAVASEVGTHVALRETIVATARRRHRWTSLSALRTACAELIAEVAMGERITSRECIAASIHPRPHR